MHVHAMNRRADAPRRLLACLSAASRFRIVEVLSEAERCVTEIATAVGLSQSCTTRHLQALGRDGIVRRRRDGKRVLYRLEDRDPAIRDLLAWAGTGGMPAAAEVPAGHHGRTRAPARTTKSRAPQAGPRAVDAAGPAEPAEPAGPAEPAEPGTGPSAGRIDETQDDDSQAVRPNPPVRPGDLEDYLL